MNQPLQGFRAIEDLRPAPRTTPARVLWLMFLLSLCGVGLLMWPGASPQPRPHSPLVAVAAPAAAPAAASARAAEQSRQAPSK
jgi:hypothetical protein